MSESRRPETSRTRITPQRSLLRTFVIVTIIFTMLPVVVVGISTFVRTRTILAQQTSDQVAAVGSGNSLQLTSFVETRNRQLDSLVRNTTFLQQVGTLNNEEDTFSLVATAARTQILAFLTGATTTGGETVFAHILLVDDTGTIKASSRSLYINEPLRTQAILDELGKDQTLLLFNPTPYFPNQLVVVTIRTIVPVGASTTPATLVAFSTSPVTTNLLAQSVSFLPGARSYYLTSDNNIIGNLAGQTETGVIAMTELEKNGLIAAITPNQVPVIATLNSFGNQTVTAYVHWIPELKAGYVVEVPTNLVFSQLQIFAPINIILIAASVLIAGIAVFFLARQTVQPILQLSDKARLFASGDWSQRADADRKDEIGILSVAFNDMVEQISTLYRTLEQRVEERSGQLREATRIAQESITSPTRDEMLRRLVTEMTARLGFFFSAIYLVDESGNSLTLRASQGPALPISQWEEFRLPVGAGSPIGMAASANQTRSLPDISTEIGRLEKRAVSPGALSEVCVPISVGDQVLGVLDVQSDQLNGFDAELILVVQLLASEIAVTLRSLLSLETTQVSLEETNLLYRATRLVAQAKEEPEVMQLLTAALNKSGLVSFLLEIEPDTLKLITLSDPRRTAADQTFIGVRVPYKKDLSRLTQANPLIVSDLQAPSEFSNLLSYFERRGCRSVALIPIYQSGHPTMIMAIGSREKTALTQVAVQPFANLADVVGTSLDRFGTLKQLNQRLTELQTLASLSQSVSEQTELDALFPPMHKSIQDSMGEDVSLTIALIDEPTGTINYPYSMEHGAKVEMAPSQLGNDFTSQVLKTRQPLLLGSNLEDQARALGIPTSTIKARSWMGIPLVAGGNLVGALILQSDTKVDQFSVTDQTLLTTLAPQIATAIRNAQLLDQQKRALTAYDQERFLLNSLLDAIPDRVTFKDADGAYVRVSTSTATALGFSDPTEIVGKTDDAVGIPENDERLQADREVISSGKAQMGIVEQEVTPDGATTWSLVTRIPLTYSDGASAGMLGIARDITGLKVTEEIAQRRAGQLLTAAEIARDTSGTLDMSEMLAKAVNLVRERFGFYHSSIFVVDALGEFAHLRESTGDAGAQLKAAGHKLAIGSQSIVGQATGRGEAIVVNDVRKDPTYYPNPLLPDTRAELAIPLMIGDRVLGALDVQSNAVDAFTAEDISILRILADQLAVALTNAELFTRASDILNRHRVLHQITSTASAAQDVNSAFRMVVESLHQTFKQHRIAILAPTPMQTLEIRASAGYPDDAQIATLQVPFGEGIVGTVATLHSPIRIKDTLVDTSYIALDPTVRSELAVPILYGDELLGVLNLESTAPASYDENDQEIMLTLGSNLGALIANIRLVNRIRLQVDRQRQLFDITSKIRRTVDLDTILETSATEIGRALNARRTAIQVSAGIETESKAPQTKKRTSKEDEA
jgi:PAS domain S-box-containing protein